MKSASPVGATAPRSRIVRRLVTTGLALALGAVMLGAAASAASWLDRILLGLGGVIVTLYAILWQSELFDRTRNAAIVLLRLASSPLTLYPLGALLALRFLLFPSDDLSQGVGVAAGLLFLSPIILIVLIAMMFVIGRRRA